jgi:hypothetical protein
MLQRFRAQWRWLGFANACKRAGVRVREFAGTGHFLNFRQRTIAVLVAAYAKGERHPLMGANSALYDKLARADGHSVNSR